MSGWSKNRKKRSVNEARYMEAFDHPNIVAFKEVYKTNNDKLCIVMEYCDGGCLEDILNEYKEMNEGKTNPSTITYMPEDKVMFYFTQMVLGLKHMHDRKILHRDIKGDNVFRTKNDFLKLGDFGVSNVLESSKANL